MDIAPDRALKDATGSPRIDTDMLALIDSCAVFVGDVTLVTGKQAGERPSPNPNVLFELGYAVKTLSWSDVILPFDEALGDRHDLPFDLDKNRLAMFRCSPTAMADEKRAARDRLSGTLKTAIHAILGKPTVKRRLAQFFDDINPEIMQQVRGGNLRLQVMIAEFRIPGLLSLLRLREASSHCT